MHCYCSQCTRYCTFVILCFTHFKCLKFQVSHASLVVTDADSDSWTTAFVNKWLQSDFTPTPAAQVLTPQADPEV